jgi:hypothetical protein
LSLTILKTILLSVTLNGATRLLIWGLGQFEHILITGKYFILMTMVLIFFIVHNVGAKSWENGQAIAPTAVRRLIGGRDEGGIHFPDGIDSSEHRRGGFLRSEPQLPKTIYWIAAAVLNACVTF